jgi:NADH:ubiquinone oxidoreductase subunit 4 (subunit M)
MGSYGILITYKGFSYLFSHCGLIVRLNSIGFIIRSLRTSILKDVKKIVAYSSVVHITIFSMIFLSIKTSLLTSSIIILFSHGIVSPILFRICGISALELGSRNRHFMKGIRNYKWSLLWFIFCT